MRTFIQKVIKADKRAAEFLLWLRISFMKFQKDTVVFPGRKIKVFLFLFVCVCACMCVGFGVLVVGFCVLFWFLVLHLKSYFLNYRAPDYKESAQRQWQSPTATKLKNWHPWEECLDTKQDKKKKENQRKWRRRKTREKKETLREKILYKGEFGDMKSDILKKIKSRCRKNGFINGGQTRNLRD